MPLTPDRIWFAWNFDALILFSIAALAYLYGRGARTLWRIAGRGRGVRTWQPAALGAGVFTLFVALVSPVDALGGALFSAHMVQHLLLITIAAPLLAAANPLLALVWAWPLRTRRAFRRLRPLLHFVRVDASLPVAFALHSLSLWLWHLPLLYEAALANGALHALEHLALFGTGVLFWSAAWASWPRVGPSILYVFAIAAQCTALGALMTFSAQPWYSVYASTTRGWGLSPLDDQVLAGVLMWVPAGFVYLALALILFGIWLRPLPASAEQEQTQ